MEFLWLSTETLDGAHPQSDSIASRVEQVLGGIGDILSLENILEATVALLEDESSDEEEEGMSNYEEDSVKPAMERCLLGARGPVWPMPHCDLLQGMRTSEAVTPGRSALNTLRALEATSETRTRSKGTGSPGEPQAAMEARGEGTVSIAPLSGSTQLAVAMATSRAQANEELGDRRPGVADEAERPAPKEDGVACPTRQDRGDAREGCSCTTEPEGDDLKASHEHLQSSIQRHPALSEPEATDPMDESTRARQDVASESDSQETSNVNSGDAPPPPDSLEAAVPNTEGGTPKGAAAPPATPPPQIEEETPSHPGSLPRSASEEDNGVVQDNEVTTLAGGKSEAAPSESSGAGHSAGERGSQAEPPKPEETEPPTLSALPDDPDPTNHPADSQAPANSDPGQDHEVTSMEQREEDAPAAVAPIAGAGPGAGPGEGPAADTPSVGAGQGEAPVLDTGAQKGEEGGEEEEDEFEEGNLPSIEKSNGKESSNPSFGKYKTVSYRKIKRGNTKQRIDEFESMLNT